VATWWDNDPEIVAGVRRYRELEIAKADAQNRLNAVDVEYTHEHAPAYSQTIANCEAEQANLELRYQRRVAQAYQPMQAPMTPEEFEARDISRLTPADGVAINLKGTRFEGQNVGNDPNFVRRYNEGLEYLAKEKQR
jgi:hypothetical protein